MLLAPMDSNVDPNAHKAPLREQMSKSMKDVSKRSVGMAIQFRNLGGIFSCTDCLVEKARGTHDCWNGTISGVVCGGILAIRGGPTATVFGAAGFGAFSFVIDRVM